MDDAAGAAAAAVKGDGEGDEEEDDDDLDDEGGLEDVAAGGLLGRGQGEVGGEGGAGAVEALDEGRDYGEGGDDAAGVDGGVVRNVVEEAAEDVVVGEFEEGAGGLLVGVRG